MKNMSDTDRRMCEILLEMVANIATGKLEVVDANLTNKRDTMRVRRTYEGLPERYVSGPAEIKLELRLVAV